jgi:predicted DNA-binding transcriptional regulator AlpA
MSEQQEPSILLWAALIDAFREALRTELHNLGVQPHTEDRLLDAEAAAQLLSVSTEWLYRNSRRLPFTRKLGHKMLRFSYRGIQEYLSCRATSKNG